MQSGLSQLELVRLRPSSRCHLQLDVTSAPINKRDHTVIACLAPLGVALRAWTSSARPAASAAAASSTIRGFDQAILLGTDCEWRPRLLWADRCR